MVNTVICPRCGTENLAGAVNCAACGTILGVAQDHPAENEPYVQENPRTKSTAKSNQVNDPGNLPASNKKPVLLPVLLLLGSFIFAFCLGEAVHELGHFLVHRAYGVNVGIRLDPFGGSMILSGSSAPREIWGITSLGGPLLNLLTGVIVSLSLWRIRKPVLLPLLLWGPVALIQEGVTFSLGMLTPGGDTDLIVAWGVPASVLIGLGVVFFAAGIAMICWLLPLVNLSPLDSFGRKLTVVMGGMVSFMVLRLLLSGLRSPDLLIENTVPLVFSLLLAAIVLLAFAPLHSMLNRISKTRLAVVTWPATLFSIVLGAGIILFQLVSFN